MNFNLLKVSALVLILVVESKGGLVGGIYDTIKNTTTGLTTDVKNAWSYGKGFVISGTKTEEPQERGLIGGMLHSAHKKIHYLHEEIWKVDEIPNDSGLLWNMYNRLKQRLANAKHFILGDKKTPAEVTTVRPNPEAILIKETMEKLFNPDGTRKVSETSFTEAIEELKKKIVELRKDAEAKVEHGEGLIDIRMGNHKDLNENVAEAVNVHASKDNINNQENSAMVTSTNSSRNVSKK